MTTKNNEIESNVTYYNRHFPAKFSRAKNAFLFADDGKRYIDFFASAGSVNYGHNNDFIKEKVVNYIQSDGIIQGLDLDTLAKEEFLRCLKDMILDVKGYNYKVQLCSPSGTSAVEAALRLAHKITGRKGIFALAGGFHGMTLGSLSVSSIKKSTSDYALIANPVTFVPYSILTVDSYSPISYIESLLENEYSGVETPAAFIFETVQAESGINIIDAEFFRKLQNICQKHGILLICDDVQVGCFRTGNFFSFDDMGVYPDLVIMSKSISGYGTPMALLLLKSHLDVWNPGEHNGTFRGNQLAFVGAKAAIEFASLINITDIVKRKASTIEKYLLDNIPALSDNIDVRGKGMIWGIDLNKLNLEGIGCDCSKTCFDNGLIIETCGKHQNVLKILPPLTIEDSVLYTGLEIITSSIAKTINTI